MSNKRSVGRPKVTDKQDVVSLLVASFHSGFTIREACWQSGISHEAYYQRLRSDVEFADIMVRAQSLTTMKAKQVIIAAIEKGNIGAARWWLERKASEEFGNKNIANSEFESSENKLPEPLKGKQLLESIKEYERDMIAFSNR